MSFDLVPSSWISDDFSHVRPNFGGVFECHLGALIRPNPVIIWKDPS